MEQIYHAANAASLMVLAGGWRISRINQARRRAAQPGLSKRLKRFYIDEIEHAIDLIIQEMNCDPV